MRKLWRLGFQASLDEVITVGAALQFLLWPRRERRRGVRGRLAGAGRPRRRRRAADRQQHGVRHPRRRRRRRRARRLRLRGAQDRRPGRAARRRADRRDPRRARSRCPTACGPASGAVLAAIETAARPQGRHVVGKPEPAMYEAARDRLGDGQVPRGRRPARRRRRRRAARGDGLRAGADRRDERAPRPTPRHAAARPRRRVARALVPDPTDSLIASMDAPSA